MTDRRPSALPPDTWPRGMSREVAARYIGVSVGKFDEMVADKRMPKPVRIDRRVVWDRRAVDKAFDALPNGTGTGNPWDEVLGGDAAA